MITVSRAVAVVDSSFSSLFDTRVEGAPTPAVVVIAVPPGSIKTSEGSESEYPVYVMVHSSDTGECPAGQSKFICMLFFSFLVLHDDQTFKHTYLHCLSYGFDVNELHSDSDFPSTSYDTTIVFRSVANGIIRHSIPQYHSHTRVKVTSRLRCYFSPRGYENTRRSCATVSIPIVL